MFSRTMLSTLTAAAVAFSRLSAAGPLPNELQARATGSLSSYIATESQIALSGVLANIGSSGSAVPGAGSGLVIASPSTSNPDCMYSF
jgi:glucoamylase